MYLAHFGLNQPPFGITPNPSFFFSGSKRGEILDALLYAVVHGEGIVKVTGEVGSGKTMLCRMLEDMLPENVEVLYLVNPTLTREQVLYTIVGELNLPTGGKRVDEIIRMLHSDLIAKHIAGKQVVLLVEEGQAMPLQTLEEIRLFSNLETAHHKLIQIVLFGQPELDDHLNLPCMRQLKERITHSFKVPPLTSGDIPEYLMFRLRTAGYRGPDIFNGPAIKLIDSVSQGIVRRVSILADKALLAAFADNSHSIQAKHVKSAIEDSEFPKDVLRAAKLKKVAISLAALALAGLGVGWRYSPSTVPGLAASTTPSISATKALLIQSATPAPQPAPVAPASSQPATSGVAVISSSSPSSTQQAVAAAATNKANASMTQVPASSGEAPKPSEGRAPLEQRLQLTKVWLNQQSPDRYSVQVMLISPGDPSEVARTLHKIDSETGLDEVYVYSARNPSHKYFGIVYGSYVTRAEAMEKLDLFAEKWGYRPQLRTIGGIKKEMAQAEKLD